MSQEAEQTESFLSWQGQISGPHLQKDIQHLLKIGKIHSLYKIQIRGEWILLRDYLADMDQKTRETARREAEMPPAPAPTYTSGTIPHAVLAPDYDFPGSATSAILTGTEPDGVDNGTGESKGLAIASFVLSCFFFIPFLNLLTWLMSLIFGHLAASQIGVGCKGKAATLNTVGLWLSYVELGFFLSGLAFFKVTEFPIMGAAFLMLHGHMLGIVFVALIGAGVLMLAVKLAAGKLISFSTCFVGALLPTAMHNFMQLVLAQTLVSGSFTSNTLVIHGFIYLSLFVGQIFFWVNYVPLPDGRELGYANATLSSLLYTVIFIFISFGYFLFMASVFS